VCALAAACTKDASLESGALQPIEASSYLPSDEPVKQGKLHYRNGDYGLAEENFRHAVEATPRDVEAWVGLAASYDQLRRFELADRAYKRAIRLVGRQPTILNNMGYSYMLRGDMEKARRIFLEAYDRDPGNLVIQNNLARLDSGTAHVGPNPRTAAYIGTDRPQYEASTPRKRAASAEDAPSATVVASASPSQTKTADASSSAARRGPWSIQVGSFPSKGEATRQIKRAEALQLPSLMDHEPKTLVYVKDNETFYRARFDGFGKKEAQAACADLASRSIACLPIRGRSS
jgi:tetratricopeptide (TPR) repeat protein